MPVEHDIAALVARLGQLEAKVESLGGVQSDIATRTLDNKTATPNNVQGRASSPGMANYDSIMLTNNATVLPDPTVNDWDDYFRDQVGGTAANPMKFKHLTQHGEIMNISQQDTQYQISFDSDAECKIPAYLTANGGGAGSGQQIKLNSGYVHRHITPAATLERFTLSLPVRKGRNFLTVAFQNGNAFCCFFTTFLSHAGIKFVGA